MTRGDLVMDPLRHTVAWSWQRDVSLTVTEFLLLQALAQRPGFVKKPRSADGMWLMMIRSMWTTGTIDSHIKRLRKKMRTADDEFSAIAKHFMVSVTATTKSNHLQRGCCGTSWQSLRPGRRKRVPNLVIGEDWTASEASVDAEVQSRRAKRNLVLPEPLAACTQDHHLQPDGPDRAGSWAFCSSIRFATVLWLSARPVWSRRRN